MMNRIEAPAGASVRSARLAQGVSLRELARRVGVSPATMSALETGKTKLSVDRLQHVAAALEISPAVLVHASGDSSVRGSAEATVARETGHWRDFAPLPTDPVLTGAVRAFVRTGYHGASVRSIAAQSGMSVPGVYHHYASKQLLLERILDLTMTDLIWRVEQAASEGRDPIERFSLYVEALALFHARRTEMAFIGASEMRSLEPDRYRRIARLRNQVQDQLEVLLFAATAERPSPVTLRHASKAISTMCTSLAQWFHPDGATTPEEIAREYAAYALQLAGLGPAGPPAGSVRTNRGCGGAGKGR